MRNVRNSCILSEPQLAAFLRVINLWAAFDPVSSSLSPKGFLCLLDIFRGLREASAPLPAFNVIRSLVAVLSSGTTPESGDI